MALTRVTTVTEEALDNLSTGEFLDPLHLPYSMVPNDSSAPAIAANDAAMAQLLTDAKSSNKPVIFTGGQHFYISAPIVLDQSRMTFISVGLATRFWMTATNTKIVHIGISGGNGVDRITFGGFELYYSSLQTGSSAVGLTLQNVWYSDVSNLDISNAYDGVQQVSGSFFFSNTCTNWRVKPFYHDGIDLSTSGQSNTGNVLHNFYVSGGSSSSQQTITGVPVTFTLNAGTSVSQMNIEWVKCPTSAMLLNTARPIAFNSFHIEGVSLLGNDNGFIHLIGNSVAKFSAMDFYNYRCKSADGANTRNGLFSLGDSCSVSIDGIHVENPTSGNVTCPAFDFVISDTTSPGAKNPEVDARGFSLGGSNTGLNKIDGVVVATSGMARSAVTQFDQSKAPGASVHSFGDADASILPRHYGRFIRFNTPLTASRSLTLQKAWGWTPLMPLPGSDFDIYRTAAATGAFDLVIKNHDGATLKTLSSADSKAHVVFDGSNWLLH